MSRGEVLEKLVDLRRREGDEHGKVGPGVARVKAFADLERMDRAGLTVLPCTIHDFIARAGLLVLDPDSPDAHDMVAQLLHGSIAEQGTMRPHYLDEAEGLLHRLREIQNQLIATEAGG